MVSSIRAIKMQDIITDIAAGPFGSNLKVSCFVDQGVPIIDGANLKGIKVTDNVTKFVTNEKAESLYRSIANRGDIVVTISGNVGQIAYIPYDSLYERYLVSQRQFRLTINSLEAYVPYIVYYFHTPEGQHKILSFANQTGVPALAQPLKNFKNIKIDLPDLETQKKIAKVLSALDDKIELNNQINKNLEEQANALFDNMFPNISQGNKTVGDYIVPKRGKSLLSKDAVLGDVPVVAGGLEPSTYHNESNTTAPVITISASGANAGYVSLWHIPVWSSDSSYIDSKMSDNVYFWYVLLKKRQKEIYDSQTGSAQPHIYPQHIAELPLSELSLESISLFNIRVTSLFAQIANNKAENAILHKTRDTLLPKLMSGEIDVDNVEGL